jgi:hypothetical protein
LRVFYMTRILVNTKKCCLDKRSEIVIIYKGSKKRGLSADYR